MLQTTGAKAILSTPSADTELGGGLPANLLATEEGDQTEPVSYLSTVYSLV